MCTVLPQMLQQVAALSKCVRNQVESQIEKVLPPGDPGLNENSLGAVQHAAAGLADCQACKHHCHELSKWTLHIPTIIGVESEVFCLGVGAIATPGR